MMDQCVTGKLPTDVRPPPQSRSRPGWTARTAQLNESGRGTTTKSATYHKSGLRVNATR